MKPPRAPFWRVFLCLILLSAGLWSLPAQTADSLRLTNIARSAGGWNLGWEHAGSNVGFVVQYQEKLTSGVWLVPQSFFPFPASDPAWLDTDVTNASRFYRVLAVSRAQRGKVLAVSAPTVYTVATLKILFAFAGVPITPQFNVRMYKLTYETITPLGAATRASGLFCVPEQIGPIPLLCYQHGTITETNKAPSAMDITSEAAVGVAFAASGYAAVLPDYLGLGDSPGLHPYHHARSEATACVDMLRAAWGFSGTNGVSLTNRVFLCGYSQGGHATMAVFRELERFHTNEFTVAAAAPMAGAYDLSGVTSEDFLSSRPKPNPYYFLYLLAAYQEVYHLAPTLADLLAPAYKTTLPALLGGNHSGGDINAAMPTNPVAVLDPRYLAQFQTNAANPLRLALEDNDVYRWKPVAPLRFYQCRGDQDVPPANTQVALDYMHLIGRSDVIWVEPSPGADHAGCSQPSMLAAKEWFDSMR